MKRSARLYLPALAREWWALIGLISGALGYLGSLVTGLRVSPALWLSIFLLGLVVAQFQVYHRLRIETRYGEQLLQLPQWAGFAHLASSDGAWLTVVAWGQPAASTWATATFSLVRDSLARHLGVGREELGARSYAGGGEITWPRGAATPIFRAQVGINGFGAVVMQWRTGDDPIPLSWLLDKTETTLAWIEDGSADQVVRPKKGRTCAVTLGNWPSGGISAEALIGAERTEQSVRGYRFSRQFDLPAGFQPWSIAVEFASGALADGGYVDFESKLRALTPASVRGKSIGREAKD